MCQEELARRVKKLRLDLTRLKYLAHPVQVLGQILLKEITVDAGSSQA